MFTDLDYKINNSRNSQERLYRRRHYDTPVMPDNTSFTKGRYDRSYRLPYKDAIRDPSVGPLANDALTLRNKRNPFSLKNFSAVALYDPRVRANESALIGSGVGESGLPGQADIAGHSERRAYIEALKKAHNKFHPGSLSRLGFHDNSIDLSSSQNVRNQFPNFREIANKVPLVRLYSERDGCDYQNAENCVDFSNSLFPDGEDLPEPSDFRESYSYSSVPASMSKYEIDTDLLRQLGEAVEVAPEERITDYLYNFPQIDPGYYNNILRSPAIRNPVRSIYDHKNNYSDSR